MVSRRQRASAFVASSALLLGLVGGYVTPARASTPVQAADTLRSGGGFGWGRNDHGQASTSSATAVLSATQLPAGGGGPLADAVSIAAGNGYALWVDHSGVVWAMGENDLGQLGTGAVTAADQKTPVRSWGFGQGSNPKAVKVAAYGTEGLALDANGAVWHWGRYLCSASTTTTSASPTKLTFPSGATRIVDVVAGNGFALAMDDGGRVYAWGANDRGQLGQGTTTASATPVRIAAIPALASGQQALLDAGRDFGVYVLSTSTGTTLTTWGRNDSYQGGYPSSTADAKTPRQVLSVNGVKALSVAAGATHGLLLTNDGVVRGWGNNGLSTVTAPTAVPDPLGSLGGLHHPYTVAAGDGVSFAASTDGTVAAWGVDGQGQLGRGATGNLTAPSLITVPGTSLANGVNLPAQIVSHNSTSYAVTDAETLRSADMYGYDFGAFSTTPTSSQTAPSHAFTLTNRATKPVTISSIVVDGSNPSDFQLGSSTCAGTIAIDATCSVTVTFAPRTAGAKAASLNIRESNTTGGVSLQTFVSFVGRAYTPVAGLANATVAWSPSTPLSVSGKGNVIDITKLSPSLIPATPTTPTPDAPLGKLPLGKLPLGKLPLGKLPLGKLPLGKLPLGKLPLGKLPLGKLPLGKLPLGKLPLGKLPLSEIPLLTAGGWSAFLAPYPALATVPPSALTLMDLLDPAKNYPDGSTDALPLDRLSLDALALSSSGLADVSAISVLAGSLRLDQFSSINWCRDVFGNVPNTGACTDGAGLQRYLLELDLSGISLDTTPVANATFGSLRTDSLSTTSSPLDDTVVADITLASLRFGGTHIGQITLSSLPNLPAVVSCGTGNGQFDCSTPGATLASVPPAAFLSTATVRDLGPALNPYTLGQAVELLLDPASYDWESLPLSSIPLAAYPNQETLVGDVDVNCATNTSLTLTVTQPTGGFTAVPGTTYLTNTRGSGSTALADPTVTGSTLTYTVPDSTFAAGGPVLCTDDSAHVRITTNLLPTGAPAGGYTAVGSFRNAVASTSPLSTAGVTITGVNNPPDDTPDGPETTADKLVIGTITSPGQVAYIPFEAPVGKVIDATVASQSTDATGKKADVDAVLYWPAGATTSDALSSSTKPVKVPFGEAAQLDADPLHPSQTAEGGALQDIALRIDRPVAAVSATRGADLEQLSAIARSGTNGDARHVLAVTGYNGATGTFTARVRLSDAPSVGACNAPAIAPGPAPSSTFYNSSGFATGDNTLVLVNTSRMLARNSASDVSAMLGALYGYTHSSSSGVQGQVLQVDGDPSVRAAYAAWDADPCNPSAADGVTRAINDLVYGTLKAPTSLKYVVIVGSDEVIPHARLEDHTRDGNEREESWDLAVNGGNPEASSMAAGYYLSDDPYGTRTPESLVGQVVYLPQAMPSRLGETAATVTAAVSQFPASGQTPAGSTALVTDYDFLANGGNDVASALSGAGFTVDHTLSGRTAAWREQQLEAKLLGSPAPAVAAVNAHFDQYRALSAYGNAIDDTSTSQVLTAGKVAGSTTSLMGRVVFSIGCHSGLDVPDAYAPGDVRVGDFAQTFLAKGAAGLVGNLGFGYADTSTTAYSAALQTSLARGLAKGYELGTALAEAKRSYLTSLAGLSAYDLKSAQQVILWGLPQYHLLSTVTQPPAPTVLSTTTLEPRVGLPTSTLTVDSTVTTVSDGTTQHTVATGPDGVARSVSVSGKPITAARFVDLPQVSGQTVRSVVPVELTSAAPAGITATFARAAVDHGQPGEPVLSGTFPASLGHLGTSIGSSGTSTSTLVVTPSVFTANGTTPGAGSYQAFPHTAWLTYYGPAGDSTPPTITSVAGTSVAASGSTPAVTAYQIAVSAAPGRTVKRVYVLAQPGSGSGAWVRTELANTAGSSWTGGTTGALGAYLVVAVDNAGDAALSTQKGIGWTATPAQPIDPGYAVKLVANPGTPASGWFSTNPQITIASNGGSTAGYQLSVDGSAPQPAPVTVTGDGAHLVRLVAPDGSTVPGVLPVLVDTVVPTVTISSPTNGIVELHDNAAAYTVSYAFGPSGPAATGPTSGVFDASTVGLQSLNLSATSVAGLTGTATKGYRVVYGIGSGGFAMPVANPGAGLNVVVPGLVYGYTFNLVDHWGNPVTTGAVPGNTVTYTQEACPSTTYKVQLPKITGATAQPVGGGGGSYTWDLQTPNSGVLVCDRMTVTANDGYTHFDADLQITP